MTPGEKATGRIISSLVCLRLCGVLQITQAGATLRGGAGVVDADLAHQP